MTLQPHGQVGQGGGLDAFGHDEHAKDIGADPHECGMAEGHDARIAAESGECENGCNLQQRQGGDVDPGVAEGERHRERKPAHACDEQQGARPCTWWNAGPGEHRVSLVFRLRA